jgi:hypothetical protein
MTQNTVHDLWEERALHGNLTHFMQHLFDSFLCDQNYCVTRELQSLVNVHMDGNQRKFVGVLRCRQIHGEADGSIYATFH